VTNDVAVSTALDPAEFLYLEAELLDERRFPEWMELLTEDLAYDVPIRATRERTAYDREFSDDGFHMKETLGTMKLRVDRLQTENAWAEDPPSRTTRMVTNVRVVESQGSETSVNSNLFLYRSQGDAVAYDLLTAARRDVLRQDETGWKLARRRVLLGQTTLGTPNLGIFL